MVEAIGSQHSAFSQHGPGVQSSEGKRTILYREDRKGFAKGAKENRFCRELIVSHVGAQNARTLRRAALAQGKLWGTVGFIAEAAEVR